MTLRNRGQGQKQRGGLRSIEQPTFQNDKALEPVLEIERLCFGLGVNNDANATDLFRCLLSQIQREAQ